MTVVSVQAKDYGSCVAAKVPQVERDMCLKEFLALRNCMQNTVLYSSGSGKYDSVRRKINILLLCVNEFMQVPSMIPFFFLFAL